MAVCTFFGHRDCSFEIKDRLTKTVENLILNQSVDTFYLGNQGKFDKMALEVLEELNKKYPYISYHISLAYIHSKKQNYDTLDYTKTFCPDGLENVPPKFSILWRNNWMLCKSDYVVAYVKHSWVGAAQFVEKAIRQKKYVINLADI